MNIVEIPENRDRPAFEADRQRKLKRIREHEEWLVASLLENLDKTPWGPNVCMALADTDHWQNPTARLVACAIKSCLTNLTLANIARTLGTENAAWLRHPTFYKNGLPLDAAEYYAVDLCAFYRGKRLEALIADALVKVQMQPDRSWAVAKALRKGLEQFV